MSDIARDTKAAADPDSPDDSVEGLSAAKEDTGKPSKDITRWNRADEISQNRNADCHVQMKPKGNDF